MPNWLDGYAILTGSIEDILTFITTRTMHQGKPVHARVKGNKNIFGDGFVPEDLYVLDSSRAFIGFWYEHDIKITDTPDVYEVSVNWDQANGLITEELSTLAKLSETT